MDSSAFFKRYKPDTVCVVNLESWNMLIRDMSRKVGVAFCSIPLLPVAGKRSPSVGSTDRFIKMLPACSTSGLQL